MKHTVSTSLFFVALMLPALVCAHTLQGQVKDTLTGVPIPGAAVKVLGTNATTVTNDKGQWKFDLPTGTYELQVKTPVGNEIYTSRLVNQYVPQIKPATFRVYSTYFFDMGHPAASAHPWGVPGLSGRAPAGSPPTLPLPVAKSNPLGLSVPTTVPRRIRVGRRQRPEQGCSNNPVIAIEEMDIDEYVKGVLPPEIGVFRSIPGAAEVYKEFAIAAKSYGLWFMLYYTGSKQRTTSAMPPNNYTWFHIDDTACNQRYSDERLTLTTDSANAVANKIMVKKGDPNTLDKLEYAASCGKHGTLPEYGSVSNLVPDSPPENGCAGSWCGHNKCAGHEVNPNVGGSARCLVRGICQWGSASWGKSGKDYKWMVAHYQPNLEVRDLSQSADPTVKLTGYAYTNADDVANTGIANVTIKLSDGQSTMTNAQGVYTFDKVKTALAKVTLTATLTNYDISTRDKELDAGQTNWASIKMVAKSTMPPIDMGTKDMGQDMNMNTTDMSIQQDMNTISDMGTDVDQGNANDEGKLDNLLNPSPGVDGGCGQTQGSSPAPTLLMLLCLGFIGLWRRRD